MSHKHSLKNFQKYGMQIIKPDEYKEKIPKINEKIKNEPKEIQNQNQNNKKLMKKISLKNKKENEIQNQSFDVIKPKIINDKNKENGSPFIKHFNNNNIEKKKYFINS